MKRIISILFLALTTTAIAQTPHFEEIVGAIASRNPQLQASRQVALAESMQRRATNVPGALEVEFEYLFAGQTGVDNRMSLGVTQQFDWFGAYGARRRANEAASNLSKANLLLQEREVRRNASQQLVDLAALRLKIRTLAPVEADYRRMLALYESEYEKGNVSILDLNKIRVEAADYAATLDELRRSETAIIAELQQLAGGDTVEGIATVDEFPAIRLLSLEKYEQMLETLPSVKASDLALELAVSETSVAKNESMPGIGLGYRLAREEGVWFNGFGVSLSLPVWGANARHGAAKSITSAATIDLNAAQGASLSRIRALHSQGESLEAQIDSYGRALVASDNLALLRRAFDAGQITLSDYIRDTAYFTDASLKLIDLEDSYYRIILELIYL